MSVLVRSIVFNVLFYLNLLVQMIVVVPTLLMPRRVILAVVRFWARTNEWLMRVVCGRAGSVMTMFLQSSGLDEAATSQQED